MSIIKGSACGGLQQRNSFTFEQLELRRLMAADLRLLKDINTNLTNVSIESQAQLGSVTYLSVRTSAGSSLWKTDGNEAGTVVIRHFGSQYNSLLDLTAVNSTLFFVVTSDLGRELWKSDGTVQGTSIVRDINPGTGNSYPRSLTNVAGMLYFSATHPLSGTELWKSNGTAAGTVQVRDIAPGNGSSNPSNLVAVGSTLYFSAQSTAGIELFKSNGTSATTVMVRDLSPGASSSNPSNLVNLAGTLYFSASMSATNSGLWKSNGTAATTTLVRNLQTSTDTIRDPLVIGNRIFFSAAQSNDRELWVSDGSLSGTLLLKDILPGASSSDPRNFTEFGGQLFFSAKGLAGRELWRSNGTSAGTFQVKDIFLGLEGSGPEMLRKVGSTLYFSANDGTSGPELWKSNGTAAGTLLVKDVYPGPVGSIIGLLDRNRIAAVNGKALFVANADAPESPSRVWVSSGSAETTTMLNGIGKQTADAVQDREGTRFINLNGTLYFAASSGGPDSRELWKTNGTSSGTVLVKQFSSISNEPFLNLGGVLYFIARDSANDPQLWKSDGTTAGTIKLTNNSSGVARAIVAGSAMYYIDFQDILWRLDGTVARNLFQNQPFNQFHFLFTSGSTLFFYGTTFDYGTELWKTDGTTAGTVLVKDINPGPESSSPQRAVKAGTKHYFIASDGIHGFELWSTEGTSATTVLVKDVNPGTESSNIVELTAVGSTLFFDNVDGLWKSNGTDESTVRIHETTSGRHEHLTNVSGKLFFSAYAGPERGREFSRDLSAATQAI